MLKDAQSTPKSLKLYAWLHILTLAVCWTWFGVLWTIASFGSKIGDFEWWLLVIAGFAGIYGLRPNLERAIDTAWLKGVTNSKALAERVAMLKPIKRKIDVIFSLVMLGLLFGGVLVWFFASVLLGNGAAKL